jgi:hypothetical protein
MRGTRLLMSAVPAALVTVGLGVGAAAAAEPVRLNAESEPAADLVPGGTGAAHFTVTNPNPFDVRLTRLTFDRVKSSSNPVGCPTDLLSTHDRDLGDGLLVPAARTASFAVDGALTLSTAATDACLDVTFVVETRAEGVAEDDGVVDGPPSRTPPGAPTPGDQGGGHESGRATKDDSGPLAYTGVGVAVLIGGALVLLGFGLTMRVLARRRAQGARR